MVVLWSYGSWWQFGRVFLVVIQFNRFLLSLIYGVLIPSLQHFDDNKASSPFDQKVNQCNPFLPYFQVMPPGAFSSRDGIWWNFVLMIINTHLFLDWRTRWDDPSWRRVRPNKDLGSPSTHPDQEWGVRTVQPSRLGFHILVVECPHSSEIKTLMRRCLKSHLCIRTRKASLTHSLCYTILQRCNLLS